MIKQPNLHLFNLTIENKISDIVIDQAIKDKTAQVEKEMYKSQN